MPQTFNQLASRLTFRQLQVFLTVHECRSYSRAGEQLGLTQPAVSSQIRQLEAALDMPVFEYVGRKLYTTAAGERLAETAAGIFESLKNLQTDLAAQQGRVAGELKLVAVNTAQYVVPYLLKGFVAAHPDVTVNLRVVNRAEALRRLDDNEDHLMIMGIVPEDKPLNVLPFLDNELIAVATPEHALAKADSITPERFLKEKLLLRESGSGSRLALELFCQERRLGVTPFMELGANDAIKHAAMAGLGVAVLPRLSLRAELQLGQLTVLPVKGFPLRRSWCVVYPKSKYPTPAMSAFVDYVRQNLKQIAASFREQTRP
ncbi:MAG: LysR family transcriptional regulator [Alcanivorax sediminis]|uniref:LysR family transcriptional regulator n=1 Tax=Alcanivorax sediminis TaxID=2663008 RepID=UPI003C66F8AB